jgi:hypothetical protein
MQANENAKPSLKALADINKKKQSDAKYFYPPATTESIYLAVSARGHSAEKKTYTAEKNTCTFINTIESS